jgi:Flp pilus assembly pilin Flp
MHRNCSVKRNPEGGQGLTEYSLLLALLALAAVAVLVIFGPGVGNIYSEISNTFNGDHEGPVVEPAVEPVDIITIAQVDYSGGNAHIDVQFDGGVDPSVMLTASPGGLMEIVDNHYHIFFPLSDCLCEVIITSSAGGSTTVMVGP